MGSNITFLVFVGRTFEGKVKWSRSFCPTRIDLAPALDRTVEHRAIAKWLEERLELCTLIAVSTGFGKITLLSKWGYQRDKSRGRNGESWSS